MDTTLIHSTPLTFVIKLTCIPLVILVAILHKYNHNNEGQVANNLEFKSLQRKYFFPYFMVLFADWLQGPYIYELYSSYGLQQGDIAILYVTGFGASVTFGTYVGALADKFGRKQLCILFCLLYTLCCAATNFDNMFVLVVGRIFGGISTSLLFSVFESWYLHEHLVIRKLPSDWVSLTFSKATSINGILAITAGIIAQIATENTQIGPTAPFMIAIPCLVLAAVAISLGWEENYGEKKLGCNNSSSFFEGLLTILKNPKLLALCLVQSLFESNMYIFVFLWTPVLQPGNPALGLTFSSFMIAVMLGSSVYRIMLSWGYRADTILNYCLVLMGASFFVGAAYASSGGGGDGGLINSNDNLSICFWAFLGLEVSVGLYFPCIGQLRSETIPDGLRANIMNWFRVPMNVITCGALLMIHHFEHPNTNRVMLGVCGFLSLVGYFITRAFTVMRSKKVAAESVPEKIEVCSA